MENSWAHKVLFFTAVSYTIFLTWGSLMTVSDAPKMPVNFDKIVHFTAYFGMVFLWLLFLRIYPRSDKALTKKSIVGVIVVILLYGIIIEVLQDRLTEDRMLDGWDILANSIGVAMGVLIFSRIFNKSERLNSLF